MQKKFLVLLTGSIALSISAVPVSLLTLQPMMVSTSGRMKTEITGTAMVPRMNISAKVIMPLIRIPVN